jgi:hypothetical protein
MPIVTVIGTRILTLKHDDDDKLYLTTLTLSAKAGFHNGRVNKSKFTKKDKGSKNF